MSADVPSEVEYPDSRVSHTVAQLAGCYGPNDRVQKPWWPDTVAIDDL